MRAGSYRGLLYWSASRNDAKLDSGWEEMMPLLRMSRCGVVAGVALLSLFGVEPMRAQLTLPQNGETLPTYEVATIKPSQPDTQRISIQGMPDGLRMENVELSMIIKNAYGANSDAQLIGGPQALLERHFDVQTKIDANDATQLKALSQDDRQRRMALMMQALLRDRFHLKMHVETRELPIYVLVVAKGGPKLQPTAPAAPEPAAEPGTEAKPQEMPDQLPHRPKQGTMMMRITSTKAEMSMSGGTMERLAQMLTVWESAEGRVVFDRTGLTGKYDWHLEWTPEGMGMAQKGADGSAPDSDAPGLFTALQEQLGLKLEPQKGQVQVVVIDHLEAPSPN